MKTFYLILIYVVLYLLLPIPFLKHQSTLTKIIFYWLFLNVLIGIYEITMLLGRSHLCNNSYFWTQDFGIGETLTANFWLQGWSEYARFDPRYCQSNNYVHGIELTNVLVSFIPSLLVMKYILTPKPIPPSILKLTILFSLIQFIATFIYYVTGLSSYNYKYWIYAIFDLPWLIMPLITIIWVLQIKITI